MVISKLWPNWKASLINVKPETVIGWHRKAFKLYWFWKSKLRGRPKISRAKIALIKLIHKENPLWSPERIHNQLIGLGVTDAPAPNTIAKYFPGIRKPPTEKRQQSWKTFLTNHRKDIWAMDFFRESTPFEIQPEYLIHNNDSIFVSKDLQGFLVNLKIKSVSTGYRSPWQNRIYERTVGILRRELLDNMIPFNQEHLQRLLGEFIEYYYNPNRTHQGIDRKTPVLSEEPAIATIAETSLISMPILSGLYHNYWKAA